MNNNYDPTNKNIIEFLIDYYGSIIDITPNQYTYSDHDLSDAVYNEVVSRVFGKEKPIHPRKTDPEQLPAPKRKQAKNTDASEEQGPLYKRFTPRMICQHLDQYVIGQDAAKRALSIAIYTHMKRIAHPDISEQIGKTNVMMIGDTGVGKTYMLKILSKICEVPIIIEDVSGFTEEGYVGRSVSDMIKTIATSHEDIRVAEYAIVFLDEIDKIAMRSGDSHVTTTKAVQDNLLKAIEGAEYEVKIKNPMGMSKKIKFNTKNVLFIAGGSFSGIDKIIEKRMNQASGAGTIGFGATLKESDISKEKAFSNVTREDMIKAGMTRELMGRMHQITRLHPLNPTHLTHILKNTKDGILQQFIQRLKLDGLTVEFTDPALQLIAEKASENKTGARGLNSVLEDLMNDILFEAPDSAEETLKVTKDFVTKNLK
jgi:ATP-dependent Clp protease ATP-binding subunit ClpX